MRLPPITRSLSFRLLLTAFIWLAAALLAGGFALAAIFRDYVVREFDSRLELTLEQMIGASEFDSEGMLRFSRPLADPRFSEPYSGWYWQVSAEDMPDFTSRSLWDRALDPHWDEPATEGRVYEEEGPDSQILRVIARDVILPDEEETYRFMVAADTGQMRNAIDGFARLITRALAFLGAGLMIAILLQVVIGLRPLRALRRGLAAVRSGRAQKLEGRFPLEIDGLVAEMNALIDSNARVLERARTHVGNLAHALKTPLSVLINESAHDETPLGRTVRAQAQILRQHIDHHLKRARIAGGGAIGSVTAVAPTVLRTLRAMEKIHSGRGLAFTHEIASGLASRSEEQDLTEIVGNLLDNACKWARSEVRIAAHPLEGRSRPMLELTVEDDGPGISEDRAEAAFERGRRLDEAIPGSGLGLAIVRDIVELQGGEVTIERSKLGGALVRVLLPAAV